MSLWDTWGLKPRHREYCCHLFFGYRNVRAGNIKWIFHQYLAGLLISEVVIKMPVIHEYSELISFRIDWFDLLAVQGTLQGLLQHHSSKASIIWCSAFFMVQLSHLYMTTGNTIALTIWTFVGKVMSLVFNTLSRFIIAILESPLDSKDIKSVNPEGNQLWIFIGRTDTEDEAPILWLPDVMS